ncbi:MAG: chromosomal replication initiator protein DnaA [Bdellovibrionales bacterium]|nr:chromosomal replication initiator protein DnaA [Bdellovibrionales bacterium]
MQDHFSDTGSTASDESAAQSFITTQHWEETLKLLQDTIDPQIYAAFIEPLRFGGFNEETKTLSLIAPSKLVCNHVNDKFKDRITSILGGMLGIDQLSTKFLVDHDPALLDGKASPYIVVKRAKVQPQESDNHSNQPLFESHINSRYTFDNFVVGSSNQFCHAAAMRVSEQPGLSYNPLFIYGGVGLGKTHLLHAIGNAVLQRRPQAKVLYISSESFTNELIQALRNAKMDEFKNRLRNIEVLLIDDIQFMCGKERTQEEFFHTFNALYAAKHQIVITSDKIPQDIPGIEERLQTRFSWGLTADLQAPDFETRVAILRRKATIDGFELPTQVAEYVGENISSNIRELEGALTRLHALCSLQNQSLTLEAAVAALKPILQPKMIRLTVDDIKKAVAHHFGIKVSDMISKRRTKNLSFPRHIAMYLCRKHTTCSYPEIGGHFGGRDHSSVIHAANVVSTKLEADQMVRQHVVEIEQVLLG